MFEEEEALFRLGRLPGEQLPEIACAMIEAGYDAEPVLELAALDRPTLRDAGDLFEAALATVGRPLLTPEEARASLRALALRRTATGAVTPIQGAGEIWEAWHSLGCPSDLSVFVYLDDLWAEYPEKRAAIEAEIVETARALLNQPPGTREQPERDR
jgi:hypothetical protein